MITEVIYGIIVRIESGKAYIEFEKHNHVFFRIVSVETLQPVFPHIVEPGDKVGIFVDRIGNEIISSIKHLGSAVVMLSDVECEELDKMRNKAHKRGERDCG